MGLTYRSTKGSALTITELDNNFRYFTGSHAVTGSFVAQSQRPIAVENSNFTASTDHDGYFVICGPLVTASIQPNSISPITVGTEIEFASTSSAGYVLFETGSGVTAFYGITLPMSLSIGSTIKIKKLDTDIWIRTI